jgi:hypothetical protein
MAHAHREKVRGGQRGCANSEKAETNRGTEREVCSREAKKNAREARAVGQGVAERATIRRKAEDEEDYEKYWERKLTLDTRPHII